MHDGRVCDDASVHVCGGLLCITHVSVHGTKCSTGDRSRLIPGTSLNQRGRERERGSLAEGGRNRDRERGVERETHDGGDDGGVSPSLCLSLGPIPLPSHL